MWNWIGDWIFKISGVIAVVLWINKIDRLSDDIQGMKKVVDALKARNDLLTAEEVFQETIRNDRFSTHYAFVDCSSCGRKIPKELEFRYCGNCGAGLVPKLARDESASPSH